MSIDWGFQWSSSAIQPHIASPSYVGVPPSAQVMGHIPAAAPGDTLPNGMYNSTFPSLHSSSFLAPHTEPFLAHPNDLYNQPMPPLVPSYPRHYPVPHYGLYYLPFGGHDLVPVYIPRSSLRAILCPPDGTYSQAFGTQGALSPGLDMSGTLVAPEPPNDPAGVPFASSNHLTTNNENQVYDATSPNLWGLPYVNTDGSLWALANGYPLTESDNRRPSEHDPHEVV